jgi:molybdate transport system substrate-binding protein
MSRLLLALLVALLPACSGGAGGDDSGRVRIAAASNLQPVLAALLADLPVEADVSYASSGQLLRQVQEGAPFDVFLSADLDLAERAVEEPGQVFRFADGRLALWAPDGSPVDPAQGLAALDDQRVRRVAVADPGHVPYGRAALAALRSAGVEAAVQDRLVLGESVAQALELARSGGADAAVVALSLVVAPQLEGEGRWAEVPPEAYPAVEQGGVLLTDDPRTRAVRDALLTADGQTLLTRYGYRPAG